MTRIGEELAAVSKHTYEAAEQAEVRESHHLLLHTVFLVEEPPSAAKLNLARDRAVLEVAEHIA